MGTSTNAILFYGYCWQEEGVRLLPEVEEGQDQPEWMEIVLVKRGFINPWSAFPEFEVNKFAADGGYKEKRAKEEAWTAEHRVEIDTWYADKRAVEAEFDVDLHYHCSGECPMPYVSVRATGKSACRGYPQEVTAADLAVGADWDAKLNRWMAEMGIKKPHESPKWWLVSYWG